MSLDFHQVRNFTTLTDLFKAIKPRLEENIPRNENRREKKLRRFLQISNYLNFVSSIAFFLGCIKLEQDSLHPFILFGIVSFSMVRTISRSFEIAFAFTKDVIKEEKKNSNLSNGERIILGINSYLEIIINYAILYYLLSVFQISNLFAYKDLNLALFRSIGISSFTGINVSNLDYFAILQLFTSLSLIYFAFAGYVGSLNSRSK